MERERNIAGGRLVAQGNNGIFGRGSIVLRKKENLEYLNVEVEEDKMRFKVWE